LDKKVEFKFEKYFKIIWIELENEKNSHCFIFTTFEIIYEGISQELSS
jgi:hypothetical protein